MFLSKDIKNVETNIDGNLLVIDMCFGEEKLLLVNLYAPNTDKPDFLTIYLIKLIC